MAKVRITELVEDFDLYPRSQIDSVHVQHIADAIRAGCVLPPIVADRKTKRIVDGLHRCRAARRVQGKDAEVEVEWRTYRNDAELYLSAMQLNASHGRNLTPFDRTVAIGKALRLEIDTERIASALNMTVDLVTEYTQGRVGHLRSKRFGQDEAGSVVALKYPVRHMAGQMLTAAQAAVMSKLGGNSQLFVVNSLIRLIETKLLDENDDRLVERLRILSGLLNERLLVIA